jgi:hypothetical protein
MARSSEDGNEPSDSFKDDEFLEQLRDIKEGTGLWD